MARDTGVDALFVEAPETDRRDGAHRRRAARHHARGEHGRDRPHAAAHAEGAGRARLPARSCRRCRRCSPWSRPCSDSLELLREKGTLRDHLDRLVDFDEFGEVVDLRRPLRNGAAFPGLMVAMVRADHASRVSPHLRQSGRDPATGVEAPRCLPTLSVGMWSRLSPGNERFPSCSVTPYHDCDAMSEGGTDDRAARPARPHPVTGAWMPGDPLGARQFFTIARPPARARRRRDAARRHPRLRDVGHARRRRRATPSCCATPGPATATPPARPARATPRPAGGRAWSGPGMAIDTDRWFVVCVERARRLPGLHRARRRRTRSTAARTAAGSRSSPSATWCAPRPAWPTTSASRRWHCRDRRLDGRHAGARVGDHVPRIGCGSIVPIATCAQATRAADRVGCHRPSGHPPGPEVARRRLLRRRAAATARGRACRSPAWSPR